MKTLLRSLLPLGFLLTSTFANAVSASREWEGAWRSTEGSMERVLLIVDGYFTHTTYERANPQFHRSYGGPMEMQTESPGSVLHFDSAEPARVGKRLALHLARRGAALEVRQDNGAVELWERMEESPGALTGVWRISGRMRGGELQPMPLAARRTLKVLTGGRFQWIAMNIETGEFSGTGGGRYTFENGTYTEMIEFFSRDATRVGAKLDFQGSVQKGDWHHQGLSSRGEPIHEVWSKIAD